MVQRWRRNDLVWGAGLVALAVAIVPTLTLMVPHPWAVPLVALAVALVWPHRIRRVVPAALILAGLYGFVMVDNSSRWQLESGQMYQNLAVGMKSLPSTLVILTLAYGLLVLGGWLAWRTADRTSELGRLAFGRLAVPEKPWYLWAFLLVPVVLAAGELLWPTCWFRGGPQTVLSIAVLIGTYWLVTRHPVLALRMVALGLIIVGVAGALANRSSGEAFTVSPGQPARFVPGPGTRWVVDGVLVFQSGTMAGPALLQALAFVGLGLGLTPLAFPVLGRLVGLPADLELVRRVQRLTESRAVVVDTAAADLRRLERDLHDGAQARLVALGMNLRAAEKLIPVSPDAALALVAEARETSARALTELRELVRGVHPPVLADRGLGDALRALALDTPMKIKADIDLPDRLPAPMETACYFAVAEVLTNAVKHSGARVGQVSASHRDGTLRITVTDFGVGGADPARGTGLAGIEKRLAAFDGIVAVSSPVGGPTM
ncbi:MAG TPA: histidine kinase, partial [Streptosporangiaceae bacterium]|nr:histidine kinase [Streptosporangiaceae bacterium]